MKALWKPKLPGDWCNVWCGCEEIFFKGYLKIQYFFPSLMERRRCNTLRHNPNQTDSLWKKYPQRWKHCSLLLSNAMLNDKEAPLLCDIHVQICHTLTTFFLLETSLESKSLEHLITFLMFLVQKLWPKNYKVISYLITGLIIELLHSDTSVWHQSVRHHQSLAHIVS